MQPDLPFQGIDSPEQLPPILPAQLAKRRKLLVIHLYPIRDHLTKGQNVH
jgi:hypothetical protein